MGPYEPEAGLPGEIFKRSLLDPIQLRQTLLRILKFIWTHYRYKKVRSGALVRVNTNPNPNPNASPNLKPNPNPEPNPKPNPLTQTKTLTLNPNP